MIPRCLNAPCLPLPNPNKPHLLIQQPPIAQADPDLIRNELPENTGYIREDPLRAGSQTHREAG